MPRKEKNRSKKKGFVVLIDHEVQRAAVYERLKNQFDNVYYHRLNAIFVAGRDIITSNVIDAAGIGPDCPGAVLRLSQWYGGNTDVDLWDWMNSWANQDD